jgi:hypothetical protein
MSTTTDTRQALRRWILDRNHAIDPADLRDDTPLVSTRLVTSLHVMDLILFIESLRQAPVDVESLRPGAFGDLATIHRTFFEQER